MRLFRQVRQALKGGTDNRFFKICPREANSIDPQQLRSRKIRGKALIPAIGRGVTEKEGSAWMEGATQHVVVDQWTLTSMSASSALTHANGDIPHHIVFRGQRENIRSTRQTAEHALVHQDSAPVAVQRLPCRLRLLPFPANRYAHCYSDLSTDTEPTHAVVVFSGLEEYAALVTAGSTLAPAVEGPLRFLPPVLQLKTLEAHLDKEVHCKSVSIFVRVPAGFREVVYGSVRHRDGAFVEDVIPNTLRARVDNPDRIQRLRRRGRRLRLPCL
ncbi:hypothetical protein C8R43DRAFT_1123012 [Mycena crocata]|nr:hypothetical protein C8R43DRAFT_1123012 [Mycena crocata]